MKAENQMSELLPCPFCGSPAKVQWTPVPDFSGGGKPEEKAYHVECTSVGTRCPMGQHWLCSSEDAAFAAWNRRPPATQPANEDSARLGWAVDHPDAFCTLVHTMRWTGNKEANLRQFNEAIDTARKAMTPDDLDTKTDAELNELFAVKVAEIPYLFTLTKRGLYYRPNAAGYTSRIEEAWQVTEDIADQHVYPHDIPVTKQRLPYPPFCTDANAVLPWLQKHDIVCHFVPSNGLWHFRTYTTPSMIFVESPAFARGGVLILLRAKRSQP